MRILLLGLLVDFPSLFVVSFSLPSRPRLVDGVWDELSEQIEVPFVPQPILQWTVCQCLERLSQDLSPTLVSQLEDMIHAEQTETPFDDVTGPELDRLADATARELVPHLHIPVLSESQLLLVLQQVLRLVYFYITMSDDERRTLVATHTRQFVRDVLESHQSRRRLVRQLEQRLPAELVEGTIEKLHGVLSLLLPPEVVRSMHQQDNAASPSLQDLLVERVNAVIDFPGLSEAQEADLIRTVVQVLLDEYGMVEETLDERREFLLHELEQSRIRFEREQDHLRTELDVVERQIEDNANVTQEARLSESSPESSS